MGKKSARVNAHLLALRAARCGYTTAPSTGSPRNGGYLCRRSARRTALCPASGLPVSSLLAIPSPERLPATGPAFRYIMNTVAKLGARITTSACKKVVQGQAKYVTTGQVCRTEIKLDLSKAVSSRTLVDKGRRELRRKRCRVYD